MTKKSYIIPVYLLICSLLACSLITTPVAQAPAVQEPPINVETAVARTRAFDFAVQTAAAANQAVPNNPVVPATSQAPAATTEPTVGNPMVSVSMDTNCRKGPSTIYDDISYLLVGKTSEVVNKYQNGQWWVIKDPNNPNQKCWLWGYYATVSGNWQQLPEATQPPTPTIGLVITIEGNVSEDNYTGVCPVTLDFTWTITSTLPIAMNYTIASSTSPFSAVLNYSFGPGTKTFTYDKSYNADGVYWDRFVINNPISDSEQINYTINCN